MKVFVVQSLLFRCVFGFHGFGYTHLGKRIDIKEIVRFMTQKSVIYTQFSGALKRNRILLEKFFSFHVILG